MKLSKLACIATLLSGVSGVAVADPITITNDYGTTDIFQALGATDLSVTSVYTTDGSITAGSEATDLIGKTFSFSDTGTGVIDTLDPLLGSVSTNGYGDDWTLDFSYNVGGTATFFDGILPVLADGTLDGDNNGEFDTFDGINPTYTFGTFEFFYNDLNAGPNDGKKVLELNLLSFEVTGPNVLFFAEVDYSFMGGADTFVEDFFTDSKSGLSFYDWSVNTPPQVVKFRADFNVDPNLIPTCPDAACATVERTTDINVSAVFQVPEPGSLAVLGLGLVGLGLMRRKV